MAGDNKEPLVSEVSFLFSLTQSFSNAFGIKAERVRNWRLMGIFLELEDAGEVPAKKLRPAIRPLLPPSASGDSLYPWLDTFFDDFHNDRGQFLERIRGTAKPDGRDDKLLAKGKGKRTREANTRAFQLSGNFRTCARNYVHDLVTTKGSELGLDALNLTDDLAHKIVKSVFTFQTKDYWKIFNDLLTALAKVAAEKKYSAVDLEPSKFTSLHWLLVLLFWRLETKQPGSSWDEADVNTQAADIFRLAYPSELMEVLQTMSNPKGCQILKAKKDGTTARYSFNPEYDQPVLEYASAAVPVRERWRASLKATVEQQ